MGDWGSLGKGQLVGFFGDIDVGRYPWVQRAVGGGAIGPTGFVDVSYHENHQPGAENYGASQMNGTWLTERASQPSKRP